MSGGTGSPIVSGASLRAFDRFKSFTFSLIMNRCSWVRLMVRGWGAIAGLSASCARQTCSDGERIMAKEDLAATMRSPGYRGIMNTSYLLKGEFRLGHALK